MIEFRVGWGASSNISFRGYSDWEPWEEDEATAEQVEDALYEAYGQLAYGLDLALEYSGFEWWVETREAE